MPSVQKTTDAALLRRQEIARNYLRLSRTDVAEAHADMEQVMTARARHVVNARTYGLTFQAIADELGISEFMVRKIAKGTK